MLVLLIIFMVAAPLMVAGVPVELPKTTAPRARAVEEADGRDADSRRPLSNSRRVRRPQLRSFRGCASIRASEGDAVVYVRGDTKAAYGDVMEILDARRRKRLRARLAASPRPQPRCRSAGQPVECPLLCSCFVPSPCLFPSGCTPRSLLPSLPPSRRRRRSTQAPAPMPSAPSMTITLEGARHVRRRRGDRRDHRRRARAAGHRGASRSRPKSPSSRTSSPRPRQRPRPRRSRSRRQADRGGEAAAGPRQGGRAHGRDSIEQNVGAKQSGGDATARRAYMGEVAKKLQRSKVNPRSTLIGHRPAQLHRRPAGRLPVAHHHAELRLEAARRRRHGGARARGAVSRRCRQDIAHSRWSSGPVPLRHALIARTRSMRPRAAAARP